jgi:hypothetical protein
MNLDLRRSHYDTVEHSERKPRVNLQSCVGYRVCFETRGVVLCKSHDVEIRMLSVCIIREENRKEMKAGRRDLYTRVLAMSW